MLRGVLRDETNEIKASYASPRRTEVLMDELGGIDIEDLIPDEDVVITLSRRGYIKRTTLATYQQQKRGGKGIAGLHTSDDDFVQDFLTTTNHQYLLLFTSKGRMHQLKVHQVPEGSRTAKGVHIALSLIHIWLKHPDFGKGLFLMTMYPISAEALNV